MPVKVYRFESSIVTCEQLSLDRRSIKGMEGRLVVQEAATVGFEELYGIIQVIKEFRIEPD